ncbi:UNVERIFIED_CONTAM: hypothetical protein HDU68_011742 [Siphonaria sp. JEL0065]|nr:hypothetical protein HDU68_011742 [Siphonaria sp. JEL0065]
MSSANNGYDAPSLEHLTCTNHTMDQLQIPTINLPSFAASKASSSSQSHSTISNTPNSSTLSTANATPRLINQQLALTQQQIQQQKPLPPRNTVGKLQYPDPIPPPSRLTIAPIIQQSNQDDSLDYLAIKNAADYRPYPVLSRNDYLLTQDRKLKPASEREKLFEELEARVLCLKEKCGEVVRGAKALQRACNSNLSGISNGNGTGGPSIQFGGGVRKKVAANGAGSSASIAFGGNTTLKEKLRYEVIKLVQESRKLRESIEASPSLDRRVGVGSDGGAA